MAYEQINGEFDFGLLPNNFKSDVQIFQYGNNGQGVQTWIKPPGVSLCYMILVSGGGGGGAGFTGISTSLRGGGGGGACSGVVTLIRPAITLPDILYVQVGSGGIGGSVSGVAGSAGKLSVISYGTGLGALTAAPNLLLTGASSGPGGGGAGSGVAGGAGGAVPGALLSFGGGQTGGMVNNLNGIAGTIGGSQNGTSGSNTQNAFNTIPFTPGTGGGGVSTAAGGLNGGGLFLQGAIDFADGSMYPGNNFIAQATIGSDVLPGGDGPPGISMWKPFLFTGGLGGGSAGGQPGGRGGNGAIGCGGGGGGAGTTGGAGGNGGDGLVMIISW